MELLDNLETTNANPSSFEILVKVDSEDTETCSVAERESSLRPYSIVVMKTPRGGGYYSLHHAYQELLEQGNAGSYFVILMNDEVRFKTQGWDDILQGYIGHFPDDIFRLRISDNRERQYHSLDECCAYPENFAVTTRAWYEFTEGMGDLWGPDSWHQAIEYMLGTFHDHDGTSTLLRGVSVSEIELHGTQASVGTTLPEVYDKVRQVSIRWSDLNGWHGQENFLRLAARLAVHIHSQAKGFTNFDISENRTEKTISSYTEINGNKKLACQLSYKLTLLNYGSEIFRQFFGLKGSRHVRWVLKSIFSLPKCFRKPLEPIAIKMLYFWMTLRRYISNDSGNTIRIDKSLKQIQKIDSKTGQVNAVISARLL